MDGTTAVDALAVYTTADSASSNYSCILQIALGVGNKMFGLTSHYWPFHNMMFMYVRKGVSSIL